MLFRIAIDHGEHDTDQRLELLFQLAQALFMAGRDGDTVAAYLEAAELATGAGRSAVRQDARRRAAEQMMLSGDVERGIELISVVFADVGETFPASPRLAMRALLWDELRLWVRGFKWTPRDEGGELAHELAVVDAYFTASASLGLVEPIYGYELGSRGLLLALRAGEPRRIAYLLSGRGMYQALSGVRRYERIKHLFELARLAAEKQSNPRAHEQTRAFEGMACCLAGRWSEAFERLDESARAFDKLPVMFAAENLTRNLNLLWHCEALRMLGRLSMLTAHFDRLRDATRRSDRYIEATLTRAFCVVWLAQDKPVQAKEALRALTWVPLATGFHAQDVYEIAAQTEIALYLAEDRPLLGTYRSRFSAFDRSLLTRVELGRCAMMGRCGRIALSDAELGFDRARALREAQRWSRRLLRADPVYARAWGATVAAGVDWQRGDILRSIARLREAVARCDEAEMSSYGAAARWRLGQLLGGDEGAALLAEAYGWAEREGVKKPDRFLRVYAPGFDRRPDAARLLPAAKSA